MKVMWLASWYPSKLFPFDGDFIQRHARAAALFCDIEVIHVIKDKDAVFTNDVKEIISCTNRLTEKIIYYKPLQTSIGIIDRILSTLKYKQVYRNAVKKYIANNGKPGFVHLHIAMKAGLTALWIKRKYNIPYILSEQWGGYLDNAKPNIKDYNFIYQHYWSTIIRNAMAGTFVSEVLKKQLVLRYNIKNTVVIPNVVDADTFFPVQKQPADHLHLIHISTMVYQKNTEGILEALRMLKNDCLFTMHLYGTINPALEKLIQELELQNHVFVKGEVSHDLLSKAIQQTDALVLYSRYETFGCVLIEANACGIPVIVSELEVFHEIVEEGVNGIFAPGEDPAALAEKLKEFVRNKNKFDKNAIAVAAAQKYNYKKIGQQFFELYNRVNAE
jgi:glycosyltransferase involved in cell wall biosynthesis